MAFNADKQTDQLIELYREAFINVVEVIRTKEAKGQVTVFYKDQLKQIMAILQELDDKAAAWIDKTIPAIYKHEQQEVTNLVQKIGMQKDIRPQFAQIHKRAIEAAAENMGDNLRSALNFAGRRIADEYRELGLAAAGAKLTAGKTVNQMSKDLAERLTARGLPALKDKAGRTWSMEHYTRMVARTTTRELSSIATQNTCAEHGCDYVYIPYHPLDVEDVCAQYADKVYCISGNDPRYPKFTEDARPPYHPNCRHTLQPYVPAIRDMTDKEIDDLIQEAPEILEKIGYQMPPAADRTKDNAAGEGIKPTPAAPKPPEPQFNLDEFRKELKALTPAERYKKAMDQAEQFIKKDLEKLITSKAAGKIDIVFSDDMRSRIEFTAPNGDIIPNLVSSKFINKVKEFNGLKNAADQTAYVKKLIAGSKDMELTDKVQLIKITNIMDRVIEYAGRIPKEEIFKAFTKQELTPEQLDKIKIKSNTNFRDQEFKDRIQAANDFITNYVYGAAAPNSGILINRLRAGSRAYAAGSIINVAATDGTGVFIHEAAHVMHDHSKEIEDIIREFFRDRASGEILENIYSWSSKEKGYKDHFFKHYVGKVYEWEKKDPKGTEIFSMGLQYMFQDPAQLYKDDPGHFTLIYAIMRGLY